jgi:hypothetical protein
MSEQSPEEKIRDLKYTIDQKDKMIAEATKRADEWKAIAKSNQDQLENLFEKVLEKI